MNRCKVHFFSILLLCVSILPAAAQRPDYTAYVNVFLGTSADHGQMSPAASAPFGLVSIGPQTYPHIHTGYEYAAKKFLGFTHTRVEGVGCMGSGGNLLIKPFLGTDTDTSILWKIAQSAGPGWFHVAFKNGILARLEADQHFGRESYAFPIGKKGFSLDLSHTLANGFVAEQHSLKGDTLEGWMDARTTCGVGVYRTYYSLFFSASVDWKETGEHHLSATVNDPSIRKIEMKIALSSVDINEAEQTLARNAKQDIKTETSHHWNDLLGHISVKGDADRTKLFYSLLYRTMQSPYNISEPDGSYRTISGELKKADHTIYNGWSVWDNYKTQLPLLSLFYPKLYQDIVSSLANLYPYGKKDYATQHEPSNTVRTEHTIVVLLDAYEKGYHVPFASIIDSLKAEVDHLELNTPDKALEYSYDIWALGRIYQILGNQTLADFYIQKSLNYKTYWEKDFKDLTKNDVDRVGARGLYQGTIWQYRWFVPFDIQGLMKLDGEEADFTKKLNMFFDKDLYNHANEPDIQVPALFNATSEPWRAQELMHKYAVDTVVQYYFNDNSRGIDPFVDRIYKNEPKAYIRTMDDDAGANSAWFVWAAVGLYPACVGYPVYYLHVPLFPQIDVDYGNGKKLRIKVENFAADHIYIQDVFLDGKKLEKNYLTQAELTGGGTIVIKAGASPNKDWGRKDQWVSHVH